MKIAVVGAGGVGGYFGGRLAAAGEGVVFLARGRHLEAIRRDGLTIRSSLGDLRVSPANATDDPDRVGPIDLVVVAVKNWDGEGAARMAGRLLGPRTEVVSFQNGVEAAETLARQVGEERVLGGVAYITASIEEPGVIRHAGTLARLRLGRLDGRRSEGATEFVAACGRAGIDAAVSRDIGREIWEKFVFLTAFSGLTALARLPVGPIREDSDARELLRRAMAEAAAVGRARGAVLSEDIVERHMAFCDGLPPASVSSMLTDLTHGNRLELPWLSGAVARMARESGLETPVHAFIAAVLGLHVGGAARGADRGQARNQVNTGWHMDAGR